MAEKIKPLILFNPIREDNWIMGEVENRSERFNVKTKKVKTPYFPDKHCIKKK